MAFSLLSAARCVWEPVYLRGLQLRLSSIPRFGIVCPETFYCFSTRHPDTTSMSVQDEVNLIGIETTEGYRDTILFSKSGTLTKAGKSTSKPLDNSLKKTYKLLDPQYPTKSPIARKILKENWGHSSFRLEQEAVISRLLDGGSAVAVFPTGAGKSLLYQVPALGFDQRDEELGKPERPGITLVISPLIALIKDQTQDLRARGISAAAIDSTQSRESTLQVYDQIKKNQLKILYCSPERLNSETFLEMLRHTTVRMIAIDEAHCVFEWGHSFRPDYLKVARFVNEIRAERVLCVTATATQEVGLNICSAFGIPNNGLFRSSSYRPNLQLLAKFFQTYQEKMTDLISFLEENPGATIIYVTTRAQTEAVSRELVDVGFKALAYHAGMHPLIRGDIQDQFMKRKDITIVATIAFGLGINKPNIRNVVHYGFPRSLEAYSQEIGRAGRDGKLSKCITLVSPRDSKIQDLMMLSGIVSKKNIRQFFRKICQENEAAKAGDVIETSLFAQSKDFDIGLEPLNMLYAKLELRFGLLRALTPRYAKYTYKASSSLVSELKTDKSQIAQQIVEFSTSKRTLKSIDVNHLSNLLNVQRDAIIYKLQDWDSRGIIDLRCTGLISRYLMLQPFPRTKAAVEVLVTKIHDQMKAHKREELARSKKVLKLVGGASCFARRLAQHFGDLNAVPKRGCMNCQYCLTKKRVDMTVIQKKKREPNTDRKRVEAVLMACPDRSDPELLAKIAIGVKSPKITMERYGTKNGVFGSMMDCDFDDLVKEFSKYCEDEDDGLDS